MKNLARGSVFLAGIVALIVNLFYLHPQVEAVTTSFSADLSNSQINSFEEERQDKNQQLNINNQSAVNSAAAGESESYTNNTIEEDKNADSAAVSTAATTSAASAAATKASARGFSATAYCLKGRTASGGGVRRGIVAADPRVLPLGTRIQVNAGPYSGSYVVADTGGAVKGRKLDIWVPSCSEAIRFGRRSVSVSVMTKK